MLAIVGGGSCDEGSVISSKSDGENFRSFMFFNGNDDGLHNWEVEKTIPSSIERFTPPGVVSPISLHHPNTGALTAFNG